MYREAMALSYAHPRRWLLMGLTVAFVVAVTPYIFRTFTAPIYSA